jgi:hypothetical protein
VEGKGGIIVFDLINKELSIQVMYTAAVSSGTCPRPIVSSQDTKRETNSYFLTVDFNTLWVPWTHWVPGTHRPSGWTLVGPGDPLVERGMVS